MPTGNPGQPRKPHSEETKKRIRETLQGRPQGPHSEETKSKIGDANRGRPRTSEQREHPSTKNLGKRHSDETRGKMSATRRGVDPGEAEVSNARSSLRYEEWKQSCLHRDGHKCVDCGSVEILYVHHIVKYDAVWENNPLNVDIDNGVTVCSKCHVRRHKEMSK
jgi:hypothetical protein